jgi:hypothetical protein
VLAGTRTAAAALAVAVSLVASGAIAGGTTGRPACFGAAARDPDHPCANPSRPTSVVPSPQVAGRLPGAPCASIAREGPLPVCRFGVPAGPGVPTVALVGDSHAGHWRAALDVVARAKGWHGVSITRTSCPLQQALRDLPNPARRASCTRWKRDVFAWFAIHPEVSTVFAAGLTGGSGVVAAGGRSRFATSAAGYASAWSTLLETVGRVVVIRDTPKALPGTNACIRHALAIGREPGDACAVPRRAALDRDPAFVAARRMASPRVRTVNLTRMFCDARRCYPAIGGALVLRDENHMTAVFSQTLGPYLLRAVDRLS